jgi:predicted SAM-dependent methyltransferase
MPLAPKTTVPGNAYLNVGCGPAHHPQWNNLDLFRAPHVVYHDVRKPLPYAAAAFDAVYSSHVLEHLTPDEGARLVAEMARVLKPGGTIRVAVPDLESICVEYLRQLEIVAADPSAQNRRRYEWIKLELLDQMVRDVSGGRMLQALQAGAFDPAYVTKRNGDEFAAFCSTAGAKGLLTAALPMQPAPPHPGPLPRSGGEGGNALSAQPSIGQPKAGLRRLLTRPLQTARAGWSLARRALKRLATPKGKDPRRNGEAHKWMYDRVSLQWLLEDAGFVDFRVCRFDESRIPDWDRYRLDHAQSGEGPRKPDSLFVEAVRRL